MRAYVDQHTCIGCGLCAGTVPEVFEIHDGGRAFATADTTEENADLVEEAIDSCPVNAIRDEE